MARLLIVSQVRSNHTYGHKNVLTLQHARCTFCCTLKKRLNWFIRLIYLKALIHPLQIPSDRSSISWKSPLQGSRYIRGGTIRCTSLVHRDCTVPLPTRHAIAKDYLLNTWLVSISISPSSWQAIDRYSPAYSIVYIDYACGGWFDVESFTDSIGWRPVPCCGK